MSIYLYRFAHFCVRHRRAVLAVWLVAAVAAIALAQLSGGKTDNEITIPGTEAQRAASVLEQKLPAFADGQSQVVFATKGSSGAGVTSASDQAAIKAALANLSEVGQVTGVSDPFATRMVSPDKRVAVGTVQFGVKALKVDKSNADAMRQAVAPATKAGLQVEFGGTVYPGVNTAIGETPEVIGLIVAFLILLITFGALIAAGVPILAAVISLVVSLMSITALASVVKVASASTSVAVMLAMSCGIDYGLFVLSRHRAGLLSGLEPEESAARATGAAGSSVVFAGLSIVIALCGLSVTGIPFLTIMGLTAAGAVVIAVLASLSLLPAMLGFAGGRITRFLRPFGKDRPARVARMAMEEPERTMGHRWAAFVSAHRRTVLAVGVLVMLVMAFPALHMRLGLPGAEARSTSNTSRQAYDLVGEHLGVGFNGPLLVVVEDDATETKAATMAASLAKLPDVVSAAPLAVSNGAAVIQVIPTSGPSDAKTTTLVHRIRDDRSAIEGATGSHILVGGPTASNIDVSSKLASVLPTFLIVVVGLAFLLLTFAFRTIVVPIKSIIGFLLSVSVAFGVEVAVFQWGWLANLLGVTKDVTVSFIPIIVLAIVFGLSSDYEVFVVSRIKERFTKGGDAGEAVVKGAGESARVVTAAALIMGCIFVAFVFTDDPTVKAIGFTFAVGVFVDAFLVRLTLVPAAMAIIGKAIWYHPRWFAKYIPDPDIEGDKLEQRLEGDGAELLQGAGGAR